MFISGNVSGGSSEPLINADRTLIVKRFPALVERNLLPLNFAIELTAQHRVWIGAQILRAQSILVDRRIKQQSELTNTLPASFDVVTCMELLEHVPDPASTVAACARLVRPGGTVIFSTLNRNPKSYLFAIIGAEYLLRLLPRGTHDWMRFLRPAELAGFARHADLELTSMIGMTYNPLSRVYRLEADTSVNYIAAFHRPGHVG